MKALILDAEKVLKIQSVEKPSPKAGEVLIKLKAAALNHRDIWITKGLYPGMKLPCILGADGVGVIEQVGAEVNESLLDKEVMIYPAYDWGDQEKAPLKAFRVLGMPDPGTLAEYITVPVANIIQKPASLTWKQAAAIPLTFLTAWRALIYHGQLKKGDKVLITGIGGGVAQSGLAIAKAIGAEVYVTSSSMEKIEHAKNNGAIEGVNYREEDWYNQLKESSGGIDLVLDSSPAEKLDNYLKFLNYGAKVVYYGSTGSRFTTLNLSKFFLRHIQLIGTAMGSPTEFKNVIDFISKHQIIPTIDSVYSLEEGVEAIEQLTKGTQVGKIVIKID